VVSVDKTDSVEDYYHGNLLMAVGEDCSFGCHVVAVVVAVVVVDTFAAGVVELIGYNVQHAG